MVECELSDNTCNYGTVGLFETIADTAKIPFLTIIQVAINISSSFYCC